MITVWGRTNSINVQKVMWAIGELGLEHRRVDAGGRFGGLDTPEYGALNPNRKIPVLDDEGTVVWESNACVRYLAARYGQGFLWREDPGVRARSDMWMDWVNTTVIPDMTVVFWGLIRTPEAERDHHAIRVSSKNLGQIFTVLDQYLEGQHYMVDDGLSMGDIVVGAACHRYLSLPMERPVLDQVKAYYERLGHRPAFREHVMLPLS